MSDRRPARSARPSEESLDAPEADADLDIVFRALAHADRRRILDLLRTMPGCSVGDVCGHFSTSRIAVMKHLAVLEEADLVTSLKRGRVRELHLNAVPLQRIVERWTDVYGAFWASRLIDIKARVEGTRRPGRKA